MATGETPGMRDPGGEIFTHEKSMGYWSAPRFPGGRMSHRSGGNRMAYIFSTRRDRCTKYRKPIFKEGTVT